MATSPAQSNVASSPIKNTGSSSQKVTKAVDAPTAVKRKRPAKKKKTTTKKSTNTQNNVIPSLAREEYKKLIEKRRAKLNDEAWLSTVPTPFPSSQDDSELEQDIEIVHRALLNNGLTMEDVTVDAFACLLEQARKYSMELIEDAKDYAMHSRNTKDITPADLMLAKEMREEETTNFFMESNVDSLTEIAHETNRRILPPIPDHCYNGIVLPDPEFTLLGRAYDVIPGPLYEGNKSPSSSAQDASMASQVITKGKEMPNTIPSYGAKRGQKQIQIALKSNNNT